MFSRMLSVLCVLILHILDDTDGRSIAPGIRTDRTDISIADIMTNSAVFHFTPHPGNGISKEFHILTLTLEHKKYKAQSCFAPYTWQFRKLRHCLFQQSRRKLLLHLSSLEINTNTQFQTYSRIIYMLLETLIVVDSWLEGNRLAEEESITYLYPWHEIIITISTYYPLRFFN